MMLRVLFLLFIIALGAVTVLTAGGVSTRVQEISLKAEEHQLKKHVTDLLEACQSCGAHRLPTLYPDVIFNYKLEPTDFLAASIGEDAPNCASMVSTWIASGEEGLPPWSRVIAWVPKEGGLMVGRGCDPTAAMQHGKPIFKVPASPENKKQYRGRVLKIQNPFPGKGRGWRLPLGTRHTVKSSKNGSEADDVDGGADVPYAVVRQGHLCLGWSKKGIFYRTPRYRRWWWDIVRDPWISTDAREAFLEVTSDRAGLRLVTPTGRILWEGPKPPSSAE